MPNVPFRKAQTALVDQSTPDRHADQCDRNAKTSGTSAAVNSAFRPSAILRFGCCRATPPTSTLGSRPAAVRSQPVSAVVVVFPCVPATTIDRDAQRAELTLDEHRRIFGGRPDA